MQTKRTAINIPRRSSTREESSQADKFALRSKFLTQGDESQSDHRSYDDIEDDQKANGLFTNTVHVPSETTRASLFSFPRQRPPHNFLSLQNTENSGSKDSENVSRYDFPVEDVRTIRGPSPGNSMRGGSRKSSPKMSELDAKLRANMEKQKRAEEKKNRQRLEVGCTSLPKTANEYDID